MKLIIASALFLSLSAQAQMMNPTDFVLDAAPESLRFIGKKLMKGSISIKSCLFENDKVIVIYGNCTKKEAPATSIKILSKTEGMVALSIENSDATERRGSISTLRRSQYDGSWSVSFKKSPSIQSSNLEVIDAIASDYHDFCYTSSDLNPLPGTPGHLQAKTGCNGSLRSEINSWNESGLVFWEEPGQDWYSFLREMRLITSKIP